MPRPRLDLTGQKFGKLTARLRGPNETKNNNRSTWICLCDCGNQTIVTASHLLRGGTKSCGCLLTAKKKDLTGSKFDRLQVIEEGPKASDRHATWICKCDCGNITTVKSSYLLQGITRSCGCYNIEQIKLANTTHGKSNTSEYEIWCGMKKRCYNPNYKEFRYYGGRGITICDSWKNSFEAFYQDMDRRPSSKHSIDRVNNDGNYEPSNCRWATIKEQNNNKRLKRKN